MDTMERAPLPAAAPSPRIVGGVLKWYAGDTFVLDVDLALTDRDGETVQIGEGHTVDFVFRNRACEPVYRVRFENIADNHVVLQFTDEVSALFPKGKYTYDVLYSGCERKTLAHDAPILVE